MSPARWLHRGRQARMTEPSRSAIEEFTLILGKARARIAREAEERLADQPANVRSDEPDSQG